MASAAGAQANTFFCILEQIINKDIFAKSRLVLKKKGARHNQQQNQKTSVPPPTETMTALNSEFGIEKCIFYFA